MSQGNQEKIKQGTGAMVAAVVGLIVAFSAYALVTFIGNTIGLKPEKGLNFVQPVYAVDFDSYEYTEKTCMSEAGCFCDAAGSHVSGEIYPIDKGEVCYGNLTYEDPYLNLATSTINILLQEEVGVKKETDDISAVVIAAQQLNPMNIGKPTDLFSRAINALLAFIGSIVLILYIYAGFLWMSSSGNAEQIKKAQNILIWTTLGAIAMASSFMIVRTVLEKIG